MFKSLWFNLTLKRKLQFIVILVLMFVGAFAEAVSLASLIPFISILVEPNKIINLPLIGEISNLLETVDQSSQILLITTIFVLTVLIAGLIRLLILYANISYAVSLGMDLSDQAYRTNLYQTYIYHISRNTSEILSGMTQKVNAVVFGIILPSLNLLSGLLVFIFILCTLLLIETKITLIAGTVLICIYLIVSLVIHKKLLKNSEYIAEKQSEIIQLLNEGMGGIRDIILDNTQEKYVNIFSRSNYIVRKSIGENNFINSSPRFIVETIAIISVAIAAFIFAGENNNFVTMLPVLGALALGGQRMLPALQQSYSSWATIKGNQKSLDDILDILSASIDDKYKANEINNSLPFQHMISIKDVSFQYPGRSKMTLENINIEIKKGSKVGIVGETGSGKSTMLDIIMSLLTPTSGEFLVDGKRIDQSNILKWQKNISHVPQSIFLSDNSIKKNIAFGSSDKNIDFKKIIRSSKIAHLDKFVNSLDNKYETNVGERGVQLSGGQRQRIGIARAVYKASNLLILDEATNALDVKTEEGVIESLFLNNSNLTVIFVTHRISTLENCDMIIEMSNGKIKEISYNK